MRNMNILLSKQYLSSIILFYIVQIPQGVKHAISTYYARSKIFVKTLNILICENTVASAQWQNSLQCAYQGCQLSLPYTKKLYLRIIYVKNFIYFFFNLIFFSLLIFFDGNPSNLSLSALQQIQGQYWILKNGAPQSSHSGFTTFFFLSPEFVVLPKFCFYKRKIGNFTLLIFSPTKRSSPPPNHVKSNFSSSS